MTAPLYEIRDLTLQLGTHRVYDGFSAVLPDVGLTGIIGPNGCGKSTLLRCLGGLLAPDRGRIVMRDTELSTLVPTDRARRIAFLPQEPPALSDMTVEGLVAKGRTPWRRPFLPPSATDRAAVSGALEATALTALRHRPLTALSGGQRQRAWIAMALAQETEVILLDEPTSYLDLPHQIRLMHLLRDLAVREDRRIVMVLHDLTLAARFCDHLLALCDGRPVTSGTPSEAITPEAVARLYGLEAVVHPDPVFGRPVVYPCQ
ncbi:ABC transporter ATP-binding protein [Celeribacter indicus]|uniref:ABC-type cobalamin/Fe3+-siderophore transport system, ATPase component n=1 Tax=Celeribacter indicus TaxID=1208324 RepID=A0A0B5E5P7_9RHOB|nr:ABC transporter ATP-binding protein [Celeribacter indicus]AJE48700.1 ABC-type cobalamin/Fe3+-siderophore transport system, ATPase component [Celeribacter indicus]SDX12619.1 iron complex transport system ATP-binding protein [Celeribacter indicus]